MCFLNPYHHATNQVYSSVCSRDIPDLRILQYHWLDIPIYGIGVGKKLIILTFIWGNCLSRSYSLKVFKGCLPQILLGPFLNTLSHLAPNQEKVRMTFSEKLKNTIFGRYGPIFPIFFFFWQISTCKYITLSIFRCSSYLQSCKKIDKKLMRGYR